MKAVLLAVKTSFWAHLVYFEDIWNERKQMQKLFLIFVSILINVHFYFSKTAQFVCKLHTQKYLTQIEYLYISFIINIIYKHL